MRLFYIFHSRHYFQFDILTVSFQLRLSQIIMLQTGLKILAMRFDQISRSLLYWQCGNRFGPYLTRRKNAQGDRSLIPYYHLWFTSHSGQRTALYARYQTHIPGSFLAMISFFFSSMHDTFHCFISVGQLLFFFALRRYCRFHLSISIV